MNYQTVQSLARTWQTETLLLTEYSYVHCASSTNPSPPPPTPPPPTNPKRKKRMAFSFLACQVAITAGGGVGKYQKYWSKEISYRWKHILSCKTTSQHLSAIQPSSCEAKETLLNKTIGSVREILPPTSGKSPMSRACQKAKTLKWYEHTWESSTWTSNTVFSIAIRNRPWTE